jgi:hypothetical protein
MVTTSVEQASIEEEKYFATSIILECYTRHHLDKGPIV